MDEELKVSKKHRKEDPFLEREKEKYTRPIPSREFIMQYLREIGKSVNRLHLVQAFELDNEDDKEALRRRLRAMERDGQIISNRRGLYAVVDQLELVRGRVIARKDGYGFLIPDDGSDDLYLSPYQMRIVFPDDVVLARVSGVDNRGRREGSIVEVLERNTHQIVGYYREEEGISFVEPEKKDTGQIVLIAPEEKNNAKHGHIVVAVIVAQPSLKRQATGRVIEILGDHMAPGLEVEVAIRSYELPYQWQHAIINEVTQIEQTINPQELKKRKDLRHLPFVTIDGEDAKDFDDAVYCKIDSKGNWRLYVAIADVSHYVQHGSALDKEAFLRGNSVYFPNRVLPMLPEELSNGICSLRPNEDRFCMLCEMAIGKEGELLKYKFYEGVIRSQARLTYTEVAKMIQAKKSKLHPLQSEIENLYELYKKLHSQRILRGALDFDTVETRIIFGTNFKIKEIVPVERNEAHRLIEEFMLMANVATALFLSENKMPLLYRVHKGPDPDQLKNLRDYLRGLGLKLGGGADPSPLDYSNLIQKIQTRPDKYIIQTILLRSLKQALYSPVNEGHFGLAYDHYCHFTSPIRRYPDLLVHRGIRHILRKQNIKKFQYDENNLTNIGTHCSMTERRADEATRDVVDWLKCEFMLDKLGNEFDGVISEVTGFGVFVELKQFYIEGLVHVTALKNDYYHFDPIKRCLTGKRSAKIYRIGDALKIKVVRVNLDQKQIDFDLVQEGKNQKTKKFKKPKRNQSKSKSAPKKK